MNNSKFAKNKKQILREFNKEKYFNIYNFFKNKKSVSIKDIDKFFCKNKREYERLEKEKIDYAWKLQSSHFFSLPPARRTILSPQKPPQYTSILSLPPRRGLSSLFG